MGLFNWLQADLYREPSTGIEFPGSVGSYKRGKITAYAAEPKQPGVAVAYRSEDAEVTVYVRNSGGKSHPTSDAFLNETLAVVKAMEEQGQYANVKLYAFDPDQERPGWKSAAFSSNSANRFLISFIYCKSAAGHLVKIRATTGQPKNDRLQAFVASLQTMVDRAPSLG